MLPVRYVLTWPISILTSAETHVEGDGFDETGKDGDEDNCVRNWRAARPDNLKSMFSRFDETGIFVAVCRHGFILTCTDMVRSGEL